MVDLKQAVADLDEETVLHLLDEKIKSGDDPTVALDELRDGMEMLGQRFADCEYSLVELMMGAEIFKECMAVMKPILEKNSVATLGKVVIGTVKGDVHDLGKNIVASMLQGTGFEVHDIGVDVPPEKFIEKASEVGADIIGLSCLLLVSIDSMRETVSLIRKSGLNTKVMIGGGVFTRGTEATGLKVEGVDAVAKNAIEAVDLAKKWVVS